MIRVRKAFGIAFAAIRERLRTDAHYNWVRWVVVGIFGLLLLAGLGLAVQRGSLETTVGDVAVNVAASALVALAAVVGFSIGTRRWVLGRLLAYQQRTVSAPTAAIGSRPNQARAVVAQLRDNRRAGSLLLQAPAGSSRASFIRELVTALSAARVVAIVVPEQALSQGGVAQAATDAFRTLLVKAGVTEVPLSRTLESLADRRRLVVVVDGLDGFDHPATRSSAEQITGRRAAELTAAKLPFLATVDPGSTPAELLDCRVTLSALDHTAIAALAGSQAADGPDRRVAVRQLAMAMEHSHLDSRTVLAGSTAASAPTVAAPAVAASALADNGALWVGLQALRRAGYPRRTPDSTHPEITHPDSTHPSATLIVERLARRLALMETTQVDYLELLEEIPEAQWDELPAGMSNLVEHGLLERTHRLGRLVVRFGDAQVGEIAIGSWAAHRTSPYASSGGRSRTAFAAEAVERVRCAVQTPQDEWAAALAAFARHRALIAAGDAHAALDAMGVSVGPPPADWLHDLWTEVDAVERITFVRRLPGRVSRQYATFLWSRLRYPEFFRNPHLLRRCISRYLGNHGADTWRELAQEWTALVDLAESGVGMPWFERPNDPVWSGSAVASLCWIMPSVAARAPDRPEPGQLLYRLVAAVVPGGGPERDARPDPGMEISLAEGCKDACNMALVHGLPVPVAVWDAIHALHGSGRSWVTRLIALQAAALAAAAEPQYAERARGLCRSLATSRVEHPVGRHYANLLAGVLTDPNAELPYMIHRYVWPDDTEALDAAGGELTDDAAIVLAATTIVLNLAEARVRLNTDSVETQLARIRTLVTPQMPACVRRSLTALTAGQVACSCPLRLCGPDMPTTALRPISAAFAYRCLSGLPSWWRRPGPTALRHRAVRIHLRRAALRAG
jgi:hypothetical protein